MYYIIMKDNGKVTGFIEDLEGDPICSENEEEMEQLMLDSVYRDRLEIIEID